MKGERQDALRTRIRLLGAAADVFAQRGYHEATIAEICKQAQANVAAVNYHFGDKESLYREAWRNAFRESLKAFPPDGGVKENASPEERFRGRITALLERISDPNNREFSIVQKELANPTGLLEEVLEEELRRLQREMESVVRELLGPIPPNRTLQFCVISVLSQCINPIVAKRKRGGDQKGFSGPPKIGNISAYARHVSRFSLAGIEAIREEWEGRKKVQKRRADDPVRPKRGAA